MTEIVRNDKQTNTADLAHFFEAFRDINRYVFKANQAERSMRLTEPAFIAKCYVDKRMVGRTKFEAGEEIRPAGFFPLDDEPTFIFSHGDPVTDLQKKRATLGFVALQEIVPDFHEEIKSLLVKRGFTVRGFLRRSRDFLTGKPLSSLRLTELLQGDILELIEEKAEAAAVEKHARDEAKPSWGSL